MAKSNFSEFWDGLPPWAKGLSVVATVGLGVWATIRIYSDIKNKNKTNAAKKDTNFAATDLQVLHNNGIDPTYVQSAYVGMADGINQALSGCGNDTEAVKQIFGKLNNTADMDSLVNAYAIRTLSPCALNPFDFQSGTLNWITSSIGMSNPYMGSLPQTIRDAYGPDKKTIAEINSILSSKGINYQF